MKNGTVKQFLETLDKMRAIYPFKDDKTRICTRDVVSNCDDSLSIITIDENTGIVIEMTKPIHREN